MWSTNQIAYTQFQITYKMHQEKLNQNFLTKKWIKIVFKKTQNLFSLDEFQNCSPFTFWNRLKKKKEKNFNSRNQNLTQLWDKRFWISKNDLRERSNKTIKKQRSDKIEEESKRKKKKKNKKKNDPQGAIQTRNGSYKQNPCCWKQWWLAGYFHFLFLQYISLLME